MILKTIALDTNIIRTLAGDQKSSAKKLNETLSEHGYIPVIGPYVTYELSGIFMTDDIKGKKIFAFLDDLKPLFSCKRDHLFKMEYDKLINDTPVQYWAGVFLLDEFEKRVEKLQRGNFEKDLVAYRKAHERAIRKQRADIFKIEDNQPLKKIIIANFPEGFEGIKEKLLFNLLHDQNARRNLINFIKKITFPRAVLTEEKIMKLANNLSSYPALRSAIFSNLYLQYLTETNGKNKKIGGIVALDKFKDFLILTEAAYCNAFLSDETSLINKHCTNINPDIELIHFSKMLLFDEKNNSCEN